MSTVKGIGVSGTQYTFYDQNGNLCVFRQGQPRFFDNAATAQVLLGGSVGFRFTTSQATSFANSNPVNGSVIADADNNRLFFFSPSNVEAGGVFEASGTGLRLFYEGGFADLTATNITDISTLLTNFVSASGVVS